MKISIADSLIIRKIAQCTRVATLGIGVQHGHNNALFKELLKSPDVILPSTYISAILSGKPYAEFIDNTPHNATRGIVDIADNGLLIRRL